MSVCSAPRLGQFRYILALNWIFVLTGDRNCFAGLFRDNEPSTYFSHHCKSGNQLYIAQSTGSTRRSQSQQRPNLPPMAASIVATLPPLPPSPLPPSPPTSPDKSYDMNDHQAYYLNTGIETPIRSPLTSGSFGTDTSLASVLDPPSDPHNDTTCKNGESCSFTRDSSVLQIDTGHRSNKRGRPARLEDYELICVLGKGCAGRVCNPTATCTHHQVLLVREARTSQVKAMKAISKRAVLTHDEMDHTMAEASILKRFAISEPHNPFIAKLHDTFTDRENFYFVMQFYPGGDLATQMEIHGIIGHHRTRFYAADIVQGLDDL